MRRELFMKFIQEYDAPLNGDLYKIGDESLKYYDNILIEDFKKEFNYKYSDKIDPKLLEFYSVIKSWKVKWETKEDDSLQGSFNILSLETLMIGDLDFLPEEYPVMKNFTLLDHFYNEAAVGLYLDAPEKGLYYFEFDADPHQLNLNFEGYLEMLKYTKGFAYWQLGILSLAEGHSLIKTKKYESVMKLFPDFTLEGFAKLYESIRIDK